MKIAILLDQLTLGGVQKNALYQAEKLTLYGQDVKIFLINPIQRQDKGFLIHPSPPPIISLSSYYPFFLRSKAITIPPSKFLSLQLLIAPFLIPRYLKLKNIDLIIAHGATTAFTALQLRRQLGIPFWAIIYDPLIYIWQKIYAPLFPPLVHPLLRKIIKLSEKTYLSQATGVITQSQTSASLLKTEYQIHPRIIFPGCNPVKSISSLPAGKYFLALSRWSLAKNPFFLLSLIQKLPSIRLIIAGHWQEKKELTLFQKKIIQQGLSKQIQLRPDLDEKEKNHLLQHCRAWIHPHFEGFGLGALEAAAYGKPIIIPRNSGANNIFKHGREGLFPPEGNLEAFVRATQKLWQNPILAQKMGRAAWEKSKKFSWSQQTLKLWQIINSSHVSTN